MRKTCHFGAFVVIVALVAGCATTSNGKREKGPDGTVAYLVEVETSEPGARIEANGDYIGKSPLTLKIFGDKDGSFHSFGNTFDYVIKAYPVSKGQSVQTKVFKTGGWFTPQDQIPKRIYFDLGEQSGGFTIDPPKAKETQQ